MNSEVMFFFVTPNYLTQRKYAETTRQTFEEQNTMFPCQRFRFVFFLSNAIQNMGVSKNRGTPKMDGENNGSKPYEQMDDLGWFSHIFGLTPTSHLPNKKNMQFCDRSMHGKCW